MMVACVAAHEQPDRLPTNTYIIRSGAVATAAQLPDVAKTIICSMVRVDRLYRAQYGRAGVLMGNDPLLATTLPPGTRSAITGDEPTLAPEAVDGDHGTLVEIERRHYSFGGEIARGGMGRVLRARDRRLGREVAVKELLDASPSARARFEREARITARLQHPAIVNIYEAGVFAGSEPFYAMKLVTGETFEHVIQRTPVAQRLGLLPTVLAIADALAYAHARSVIHRDLKPHNILVGEFGETVVIDWGLAKDLSASDSDDETSGSEHRRDESETIEGSVMGTPSYMPPEQAAGASVDARADVYAIGAILYKALSGSSPYVGKSSHEILESVLRAGPRPLGEIVPEVPQDLHTIVDKAMAREPADRYPTARELAEDLRRFTTGQLVASHRYTTWQLVKRWARRRRGSLAVAAILLVVLAVTSIYSVRRIVAERDEARAARELAERRQTEAVTQRQGAEQLSDFLLGKLRERLEQIGRLDLLKGIGDAVDRYYETVEGAGEVGTEQLRQRAEALVTLADVDLEKGDLEAARRGLARAKLFRTQLVAREPARLDHGYGIAQIEQRLGRAAYSMGDAASALSHFREVHRILTELVAKEPASVRYRRSAGEAERLLAILARDRRDFDEALHRIERARSMLAPIAAADAESAKLLVSTHETRARLHLARGDAAGADAALQDAIALARDGVRRHPDDTAWRSMLVDVVRDVGRSKLDGGKPVDALPLLSESRDASAALVAIEPANARWRTLHAFAHADLSATYEALARYPEALASAREALAIHARVRAAAQDDMAAVSNYSGAHERIARLLLLTGDTAGADGELTIVQRIADELVTRFPDDANARRGVGLIAEQRGDLAFARGDVDAALSLYRKSYDVATRMSEQSPGDANLIRDVIGSQAKLAQALLRKQDGPALVAVTSDMLRYARRAVALPGSDAEYLLVLALTTSATAGWTHGDEQTARDHARESVAIAERDAKAHPQDAMRVLAWIESEATLATTLSKTAKAEALAIVARARERLATLEQTGRAPSIARAMRGKLDAAAAKIGVR